MVDVGYAKRSIGQHLGKVKAATETIKNFAQVNNDNEDGLDEAGHKIAANVEKELNKELNKLETKWNTFEDALEREQEVTFTELDKRIMEAKKNAAEAATDLYIY